MQRLFCILLAIPLAGFADIYNFSDNFDDPGLDGWSVVRGGWNSPGDFLQSSSDDYSTICKDSSDQYGLLQSLTVDAYFGLTGNNDSIAQLRLRTGNNWDSGYLATFQPTEVRIQNTYLGGNPTLGVFSFSSSPITTPDWYTLRFDVSGRGADTNLKLWVGNSLYLDVDYTDSGNNNDNGRIGMGRLIQYDNVLGYSSDTIPEPTTLAFFGIGFPAILFIARRRFRC